MAVRKPKPRRPRRSTHIQSGFPMSVVVLAGLCIAVACTMGVSWQLSRNTALTYQCYEELVERRVRAEQRRAHQRAGEARA